MANADVGEYDCKNCGKTGKIRKASRGAGKLYVMCGCGQNWFNTADGQNILLENGRFYGAGGHAEPEPEEQNIVNGEGDQGATEIEPDEVVNVTGIGAMEL